MGYFCDHYKRMERKSFSDADIIMVRLAIANRTIIIFRRFHVMSNKKTKETKPKTGLARCMELASGRKGLIFLSAALSSLAAVASFIP